MDLSGRVGVRALDFEEQGTRLPPGAELGVPSAANRALNGHPVPHNLDKAEFGLRLIEDDDAGRTGGGHLPNAAEIGAPRCPCGGRGEGCKSQRDSTENRFRP